MTKARDTAEIATTTYAADAIGDVLFMVFNLNNSISNRVAVINNPGGLTPTGVTTTGSFQVSTIGGTTAAVTAVSLDTKSCAGCAYVQFDANIISSDEIYFLSATSVDASITLTY